MTTNSILDEMHEVKMERDELEASMVSSTSLNTSLKTEIDRLREASRKARIVMLNSASSGNDSELNNLRYQLDDTKLALAKEKERYEGMWDF